MALAVGQPTADWPLARAGGLYLLSGHLTVYADMPYVQMGPLSLALAGALPGVIYMAAVCALLPLTLWIATLPFPPTRQTYLTTLVGGMLLSWPWAAFAVQGHGDDALVVVGVVAMASTLKSHRGIWVVAGFLIALAAKPTAILFLPLPFIHSRRAGIVATSAGGLLWAPFVFADVPGFLAAGHGQGFIWANSSTGSARRHTANGISWLVAPDSGRWRCGDVLVPGATQRDGCRGGGGLRIPCSNRARHVELLFDFRHRGSDSL